MKTIKDLLFDVKKRFEQAKLETPILDARLIVQHALGITHEELLMHSKRIVTSDQEMALNGFAARRLSGEPVSRITGERAFWKYNFKTSKETLDPRHDSEILVEAALKYASKPETVLDLGTGSGCLLLSLLGEWPQAKGVGIDISEDATATARLNAGNLGMSSRAVFTATGWQDYRPEAMVDVVISNPPYIAETERGDLSPEVLNHDPHQALFAGQDGLDAYRQIIGLLPKFLKKGGYVFFEIGWKQARDVKELLEKAGVAVLHTVPDLAGHDRVIVAKIP